MAVTITPYNSYLVAKDKGEIALVTDEVKVALLAATYTPDRDAHVFWSDISAHEITGAAGYTAGGAVLANKSVTQDNANNRSVHDGDDVVWPNSTITARYAVRYKNTGTPATSKLMELIDFGANQSTSGTDFVLQWGANGIHVLAG